MKLFVGLGNPGPDYAGHRHNVGFMALERIAADHGFGPWRKAHHGVMAEGRLGGEKGRFAETRNLYEPVGPSRSCSRGLLQIALGRCGGLS